MANDLVQPSDLAEFPGAPFPETIVDAAVSALRDDAGWHIAPSRTETMLIDAEGGRRLFLPTMYLTAVSEIRIVSADPVDIPDPDGYQKSRRGVITASFWWPCRDESVEVDATHGYDTTPPSLFLVVAEYCQLTRMNIAVRQESAGGEAISYGTAGVLSPMAQKVFNKYAIPPRF